MFAQAACLDKVMPWLGHWRTAVTKDIPQGLSKRGHVPEWRLILAPFPFSRRNQSTSERREKNNTVITALSGSIKNMSGQSLRNRKRFEFSDRVSMKEDVWTDELDETCRRRSVRSFKGHSQQSRSLRLVISSNMAENGSHFHKDCSDFRKHLLKTCTFDISLLKCQCRLRNHNKWCLEFLSWNFGPFLDTS